MQVPGIEAGWQSIKSLEAIYLIIFALATGEAIRRFFSGAERNTQKRAVPDWWRVTSLAAFLCLVVPFVQGMTRYLFEVYGAERGEMYGAWVLWDFFAFTVEAVLFFLLARNVQRENEFTFYVGVVLVLAVDIIWATSVYLIRGNTLIEWWLFVNLWTLPFLIALLGVKRLAVKRWPRAQRFTEAWYWGAVSCAVVAVRTAMDYTTSWSLYFPPAPGLPAS